MIRPLFLAISIFAEGSITPTKARSCPHQSLNLVGKGKDAIYSGAISTFNQHLSDFRGPENSSHQADGKDADTLEDSDDGNVKAIDNVCNADNAMRTLTVIFLKQMLIFIALWYCFPL